MFVENKKINLLALPIADIWTDEINGKMSGSAMVDLGCGESAVSVLAKATLVNDRSGDTDCNAA